MAEPSIFSPQPSTSILQMYYLHQIQLQEETTACNYKTCHRVWRVPRYSMLAAGCTGVTWKTALLIKIVAICVKHSSIVAFKCNDLNFSTLLVLPPCLWDSMQKSRKEGKNVPTAKYAESYIWNNNNNNNSNHQWHYSPDGRKLPLIRFHSLS
jgi:hypothetical protein